MDRKNSVPNPTMRWTTTTSIVSRFTRKSLQQPSQKNSDDATKRRRLSLQLEDAARVEQPGDASTAEQPRDESTVAGLPGTSSGGDPKSTSKPYFMKKYMTKLAAAKPLLGFDVEELKPVRRTVLDLDVRFFPTGLPPGMILELKGEEGTGKTFLITYFLARVVLSSPVKTAVFIDTTHHFYLPTLITIIAHFDKEIVLKQKSDAEDYTVMNVPAVIKANPKLTSYLERISIIKCYKAEELLVTLGPGHDSTLERILLTDPNLSLVAVDAIDSYTYIEGLKHTTVRPNFMHLIQHAVAATKTPVICSTLTSFHTAGLSSKDKSTSDVQPNDMFGPSLTSGAISSNENVSYANQGPSTSHQTQPKTKEWFCNVTMDYSYFTHTMHLQKIENSRDPTRHLAYAYLRSKQSPKTALFSVVNHRAKFSIFSDMLYVDVE